MSRIGNSPIQLPERVTATVTPQDNLIQVKGPKGELSQSIDQSITVKVADQLITVERKSDQKEHKSLHGLYRALLNNMVLGVSQGYKRSLELIGIGYKASVQNGVLELNLGYSHGIFFAVPSEIAVRVESEKGKPPLIHLEGIDKQLIGQVAAKIKALRKVEPYKGTGIRDLGAKITLKAGKSASK